MVLCAAAAAFWLTPSGDRSSAPAAGAGRSPRDVPRTRLSAGQRPADGPALGRVRIPAIGVDAPVIRLGLSRDRSLQVPASTRETGWWGGGARPGAAGPTVIVGHIDSRTGPAVFARLRELRLGDGVLVYWRSGRLARYRVSGRERVSKHHFPTRRVYAKTGRPALRLITCGGSFNEASGHYRDNLIVYGRPG
jgi:LPXTG-site transpeptidase (sortase) family protein